MRNDRYSSKITSQHLERKAIIYLRQSTEKQVQKNQESQRLQYALADRARELGFRKVEVIDMDLGTTASIGAKRREGFDWMIALVAVGEVGIIFSREVARLLRTDKDWCRLMEVCQIFGTLIGDEEQIYDLNLTDDQLILGIKGTMSVVELKILHMRMVAGMEAKAKRGEMARMLPPGYVYDGEWKVVKDPDKRVVEAMQLVFGKFREHRSVRQTFTWFRSEGVELPVNKSVGGKMKIVWQLPTLAFIRGVLDNPGYAGAYVWGRRPEEKVVVDGRLVKRTGRQLPAEECRVCIKDHHEGYMSWEEYEENQRIIEGNNMRRGIDESVGATREGQGLLAGLMRCGLCGRKFYVRYWGKSGTSPQYVCSGEYALGGKYCVAFGGVTVERRFSEELLKVLSPLGVKASLEAQQRLEGKNDEKRRAIERQLEQAEYEERIAAEQYDEVDPRNRLVAAELERRWEEKLQEVQLLKKVLSEQEQESRRLSEEQEEEILEMGERFGEVWKSPKCPAKVKKKIIRAVVEEIIVDYEEEREQLVFTIHWKGGSHTRFEMPKPTGGAGQKTATEDLEIIRRMGVRYGDDGIARVLNMLGRRTGKGKKWNVLRVATARKRYSIAGQRYRIEEPEILTIAGAAKYCNVSTTTIKNLVAGGVLNKNQVMPWAPWEIKRSDLDAEPIQRILRRLKETGRLDIEGDGLGDQKSLLLTI